MRYYLPLSVVMATLASVTNVDSTGRAGPTSWVMFNNLISSITITTYMIFAIFSCAYSYRMTTRPGMSSEIRKNFIYRHIMYVLVYMGVWLPYLGLTLYTIYVCQLYYSMGYDYINPQLHDEWTSEIRNWWNYNNGSSAFTGLLMAIIRIQEPTMWNEFRRTVKFEKKAEDSDEQKPSQLQFLMSSLNVELVHIILTAVSSKTVG
jgi:hypothetical protein